jgi:chaperonin cofactor prefoldin
MEKDEQLLKRLEALEKRVRELERQNALVSHYTAKKAAGEIRQWLRERVEKRKPSDT